MKKKKKHLIEFAGMTGSGKTFLAERLQPYLKSYDGLNSTYVVHRRCLGFSRLLFHCKRVSLSICLFCIMPRQMIQIILAILRSHSLKQKRGLSVTLNILYKLAIVFFGKNPVVLDEGLIHAVWSVYLFGRKFPHELCTELLNIKQEHDINVCVLNVNPVPSVIRRQFDMRTTQCKQRHDLAPNGSVDSRAFDDGVRKYEEVFAFFLTEVEKNIDLSGIDVNDARTMTSLAESIAIWNMQS